MFELLIGFIVLLWVILAIAVGFHSRGRGRSGIIWFIAVLITGVFGLAFYLLAITSNRPAEAKSGSELDSKLLEYGPKIILAPAIGAASMFFVVFGWADLIIARNPPRHGLRNIITTLTIVGGCITGLHTVFNHGWRRFGYLLTYVPILVFSILVGLSLPGTIANISEAELGLLGRTAFTTIGAVMGGYLWYKLYEKIIVDILPEVAARFQ